MKRTIIISLVFLIPAFSFSQSEVLERLKQKYKGHHDVVSLSISGNILGIANWFANDEEDEAVKELIKSIESMNIFTVPKGGNGIHENELKTFRKEVNKEDYEDLMVIRDGDERINIMVKEKNGIISNLLMLIDDDHDFTVLDFAGSIDMKNVSVLTDNIQVQ